MPQGFPVMVNQLNLEFLNQAKNPLVKKYENNSAKIQNGPLKYVKSVK